MRMANTRARETCGPVNLFLSLLNRMMRLQSYLIERSYPEGLVQRTLSGVIFEDRKQALKQRPKTNKTLLSPVTQYYSTVPNLKQVLMKH